MDDSTLYATIAQVLPLFVLALALERRFGVHDNSNDPTIDAVIAITLLVAAALGEFACFVALAGEPSRSTRITAEIALGITGLFLLGDLITGQVGNYARHATLKGQTPRRRWVVIGYAAVVMAAALAVLIALTIAAYLD